MASNFSYQPNNQQSSYSLNATSNNHYHEQNLNEPQPKLQTERTCVKSKFFLNHSWQEIGRNKCSYCLAFGAVFIVVLSTLIVDTIVDQGPIVFMNVAETVAGQYDAYFIPTVEEDTSLNLYLGQGNFLNFTQAALLTESNIAPRKQFCYSNIIYSGHLKTSSW
jgi:hypothetical protein